MKKIILTFLMSLIFTTNIYAGENIKQGDVAAMGAILMDAKTGRVLWEKNSQTPLPMASTTKIMTAILAIEKGNLSDTVKISKRAALAPPVKMHVSTGEEVSLECLLHALMLESSNDAAVAIAEHISGSVEEFCKEMTNKAKELNANNTIFETPNGLDSENHHSTAYDMALITKYALQNEKFMSIINTPEYRGKSNLKEYYIANKNRLLREYPGANGVKTGFTGKAGQCFVGAARQGDMQLISVVLASGWGLAGREQKWKDTKKILNYGFQNYTYKTIVNKGSDSGAVFVERSKTEKVNTKFEDGLVLPLNQDEKDAVFIEIDLPSAVKAPIENGQVLGKAKIFIKGKLEDEIEIVSVDNATRHDLKTSMEKTVSEWIELGTCEQMDIILPEF